MNRSLITKGLNILGIEWNTIQLNQIENYLSELQIWNKKAGLVKAKGDELITKHLLDSLTGFKTIQSMDFKTLIDLGSGAGFPGIPLSIFLSKDKSITLLERKSKRAAFLQNIILLLGLSNVKVLELELEEVQEKFDIVTFRAFRPLKVIKKRIIEITNSQGAIVAYKGKKSTIDEELLEVGDFFSNIEIFPVDLPFSEDERNLLLLSP
jgi:16S rRNA (guanine527-N7)-methyltransferase